MPLYDFQCAAGHRFDMFVKLADFAVQQRCPCGHDAQRQIAAPRVLSDTIRPVRGMDGKMTDSLAAYRATLLPGGNPQGERYIEVGNEVVKPQAPVFDKGKQIEAIKAGIEDVKNGRVPPMAMLGD